MFFLIVTLFTFGMFYSCSDELVMSDVQEKITVANTTNIYQLPIDQAITELKSFLTTFEGGSDPETRARVANRMNFLRRIDLNSVMTIKRNVADTRALALDDTDLLYVVNFEDNNGYAVLSADMRVPAVVLALVDEGCVSLDDFSMSENSVITEDMIREEIEGFSFYDAEEDDIYVGEAMGNEKPQLFLVNYVQDCIDEYEGGGYTSSTITRTGDWVLKEQVGPLLETKWHQGSPFNDRCPIKKKYIWFGRSAIAPTGCVPTAIAQIVAYHEFPQRYAADRMAIDWKTIKTVHNAKRYWEAGTTEANTMAAAFLRNVGEDCLLLYGYSFSFGLPSKAKKYLSRIGYINVSNPWGKKEDRIIDMLRKKNPVFMSAVNRGVKGHAWVIDGMKKHEREVDKLNKQTGVLVSSTQESSVYYHCNWGWAGAADGYYYANAFNPKGGAIEKDAIDLNPQKTGGNNYKWFFNIITYDKPNR